jgi:molybdopterin converting factor small subunit
MSESMKIYVRLYAFLAERVSESLKEQFPDGVRPGSRLELDLPDGSTLENLVGRLDLQRQQAKLIFVNGEAKETDYGLQPEDEVGIFPPIAGGSGETIMVDVWLYGKLARYGGDAAGKVHARLDVDLPVRSNLSDLLEKLTLPTEERGITFINGSLSAMPGRQPDLDHSLEDGDRVAFFHLNSMWPFQYRHGVTMTPDLEREMNEDKSAFHHKK